MSTYMAHSAKFYSIPIIIHVNYFLSKMYKCHKILKRYIRKERKYEGTFTFFQGCLDWADTCSALLFSLRTQQPMKTGLRQCQGKWVQFPTTKCKVYVDKKIMQHFVRLNLYEDLQQSKRSSQLSLELVYDERKFSS